MIGLSGCRWLRPTPEPEVIVPDFILNGQSNKSTYRPGEAMIVTISLINNTDTLKNVRELDASSIEFQEVR